MEVGLRSTGEQCRVRQNDGRLSGLNGLWDGFEREVRTQNQHTIRSMDVGTLGRGLVYLGVGLAAVGGFVLLTGRVIDLGNLPGDFVYEGENVRVYTPIGTMIVLSLVITVLLNLVLRLFR